MEELVGEVGDVGEEDFFAPLSFFFEWPEGEAEVLVFEVESAEKGAAEGGVGVDSIVKVEDEAGDLIARKGLSVEGALELGAGE